MGRHHEESVKNPVRVDLTLYRYGGPPRLQDRISSDPVLTETVRANRDRRAGMLARTVHFADALRAAGATGVPLTLTVEV